MVDQSTKHVIAPVFGIILAMSLWPLSHAWAAAPATAEPDWTPMKCPMEVSARFKVDCGMVTVPEEHSDPDGPSIQIAVAVVHSSGDSPAPDPILFINGGPGARTLDAMSLWLETFSLGPLLAKRDIVFFDQRGTGYSQPALVCTESPSANPLESLLHAPSLIACRDRLEESGTNLDAYTSAQNAGDIAALGKALGYESWNLYGVSFGARIALTTLRDRPEGVRSVVLDAITPIEADLLLEDPVYAERVLRHLFAACRADTICRVAYPDVEQIYDDLVRELVQTPVSLEVTNAKTGETRVEEINGATLNGTVIGMLGSPGAAGIPGLIYELRAGNYDSIISSLESSWEAEAATEGKPIPLGAQLAIICNEEAPFVTLAEMEQMLADYPPEAHSRAVIGATLYTACQTWGVGQVNPVEDAPIASDVPVLVLAGEYDAVRPLVEAHRAAAPLGDATVVEFPGAGHAVALAGTCPLGVMAQFLDDPAATLDTSCTDGMQGPRFFVTIGLTRPFARGTALIAGIVGLVVATYGAIELVGMVARRRIPWRVTLRRVGWQPLAITVLVTVGLYWLWPVGGLDFFWGRSLAQVAVMIGPLVVAIQTAFYFASEDTPALEVVLACPRPFPWIPVERTAVVFLAQASIAGVTVAVGAWGMAEQLPVVPLLAFVWWLSSALFLSGLAAFSAARTHRAMVGVLLALLAWLVLGSASSDQFDDVFLPPVPLGFHFGWPRLFDVIQPFLWPFHPFLRPGSVSTDDFVLNRITVAGVGLILTALAARRLADPQRVLGGAGPRAPWAGLTRLVRRGPSAARRARSAGPLAWVGTVRLFQLRTIVHYEMVSSWRRGSLRAILVFTLLLPQLFHGISFLTGSMMDEALVASLSDRPELLLLAGTNTALIAGGMTILLAVLILPMMVAEMVPLDRQYRVREVIDAAPIGAGLYLAGKMLSVWPLILIGLCVGGVLNGMLSWALNGPFHTHIFAFFWATGLIPLALFGTQMGVMLAAGQPNRRRAVVVGFPAILFTLAASFVLPANQYLAAGVFQMALQAAEIDDPRIVAAVPHFPDVLSWSLWLRIGGVVLAMAVVWLLTVRSMRRTHTVPSREAVE